MKRFFSESLRLMLLLLFAVGGVGAAQAGIFEGEIVSGQAYRIVNGAMDGHVLYDDASKGQVQQKAYSADCGDEVWWTVTVIDATKGSYSLQNVATGRYMRAVTNINGIVGISTTAQTCYIKKNTSVTSDNYFNITYSTSSKISPGINQSTGAVQGVTATTGTTPTTAEWGFMSKSNVLEALNSNNGIVRLISGRNEERVMAETAEGVKAVAKSETADLSQVWVVAQKGDGYYLRNAQSGRFIQTDPGKSQIYQTGTQTGLFYMNQSTVSGFVTFSSNTDLTKHVGLHTDGNFNVVAWSANDTPGSDWKFEAFEGVTIEELRTAFDAACGYGAPADGGIYRILNDDYSLFLTEAMGDGDLPNLENTNSYSQYWRLISKGTNLYAIQNVATGRYIQTQSTTSQPFKTGTADNSFLIVRNEEFIQDNLYKITTGGNVGLHSAATNSYKTVLWSTDASASQWRFMPATLTEEQLADAAAEYENFKKLTDIDAIQSVLTTFFADKACTELLPEYKAMSNEAFEALVAEKGLAKEISSFIIKVKKNTWAAWEKEFRVQDYKAFSNVDYWAERLNTKPYGRINNPTGIVLGAGEVAFVMVDGKVPTGGTLKLEIHNDYADNWGQSDMVLQEGLNVIQATKSESYLFVLYESPNNSIIAEQPLIKIHIEGGKVNGYFDVKKHTDADWVNMQQKGLFQAGIIDLLGDYAQLRIQTAGTRQYNPTKIRPLIGEYDWVAYHELEIMGLTEAPDSLKHLPDVDKAYEGVYPSRFNARMPIISCVGGDMYATSYYTCLGDAYMSSSYNYDAIKQRDGCVWAPGHEIGHMNQGAIHLAASTEVSNNFFSNMLVYHGGQVLSRTMGLGARQEQWANGIVSWASFIGSGYWLQTQMYYNLYLYYHVLGKDPLFYQKLFCGLRKSPMRNNAGNISANNDYLHFARKASDAAGEDLYDYFEYWGFFEPCENVKAASYSTWYITCTEADIQSTKEYMAQYPKANPSMMFIDDYVTNTSLPNYYDDLRDSRSGAVWGGYKSFANEDQPSSYTGFYYTISNTGAVKIPNGARGDVAGIKVRNAAGKLIYAAAGRSFTIPANILPNVASMSIALIDGTEVPLYKKTDEGVVEYKLYKGTRTALTRYTKGDDAAAPSVERDGVNAITVPSTADGVTTLAGLNNIVDTNGNVQNLVLTDAEAFYAPQDITAVNATFTRQNPNRGYKAVCLPFALDKADLAGDYFAETFVNYETEGDVTSVIFQKQTEQIAAGTPFLLYTPDHAASHVITKSNVAIPGTKNLATTVASADGLVNFIGTFESEKVKNDMQILDNTGFLFYAPEESVYVQPFGAYFDTEVATQLQVVHPEIPTGITNPELSGNAANAPIYDLSGRRVLNPEKNRIYIRGGKKVIF